MLDQVSADMTVSSKRDSIVLCLLTFFYVLSELRAQELKRIKLNGDGAEKSLPICSNRKVPTSDDATHMRSTTVLTVSSMKPNDATLALVSACLFINLVELHYRHCEASL